MITTRIIKSRVRYITNGVFPQIVDCLANVTVRYARPFWVTIKDDRYVITMPSYDAEQAGFIEDLNLSKENFLKLVTENYSKFILKPSISSAEICSSQYFPCAIEISSLFHDLSILLISIPQMKYQSPDDLIDHVFPD